jgi:hypothetical protein
MLGLMLRKAILGVLAVVAAAGAIMLAFEPFASDPAGSAAGDVTIGQLASASPPPANCPAGSYDLAQYSSSVRYSIPYDFGSAALIKSWSTRAASAGQMLTFKVFRQSYDDPKTWTVIGHDGPRTLTAGINTFTTQIQAAEGDVIGFNSPTSANACYFTVTENAGYFERAGNLDDGQAGFFPAARYGRRLNVTAEVVDLADPPEPEVPNDFHFGKLKRNTKKGTAVLELVIERPWAGEARIRSSKVLKSDSAGGSRNRSTINLDVVPRGGALRKLKVTGVARIRVTAVWTPDEGTAEEHSRMVRLQKR